MPRRFAPAALLLLLVAPTARAELVALEIHQRTPFADGQTFGNTGAYEVLRGVARFAVDLADGRNKEIVDLHLAPRNATGKVEFASDVLILAPKDPTRGNGAILYDVNNRGNLLALRMFNDAPGGNEPRTAAHAGNGFLFRRGYTVVWCGWIGELLPGDGRLLLGAPVATEGGQPIRGVVRYEMVTDHPAESMPLAQRAGHGSYPPTKKGELTGRLTWRLRETDPRVEIPRPQWHLERKPLPEAGQGVAATLPEGQLHLAGGFRPGYIYELICEAEGPIVQGLGFAAVRDLVSFLRYSDGDRNPFRGPDGKPSLQRAYGFGVSQSGRFLRHLLYQGFNIDEQDRPVFDGLIPHVAGGGLGFFNHRFAQPTRHNTQHDNHLYPADIFPFTYGDSVDPFTKRTDGILHRLAASGAKFVPKVMHTQTSAEYWHRSGSLVHTDPLGKQDAEIPATVRVYAFGGAQHGPAGRPPQQGIAQNLTNPGDYRPFLRGLLDAMDAWVREGTEPPPSIYPKLADGTLVPLTDSGFPPLPGVRYPEVIQRPEYRDYGPKFLPEGIITNEPPQADHSVAYTVLVPRCDRDGNDLGTLAVPEVAVPVATHTGWNLRSCEFGAENMLASLLGSYLPFPRTKAERVRTGDPRPSIEERYDSFEAYRDRLAAECRRLVDRRYLPEEDVARVLQVADGNRKLFGE